MLTLILGAVVGVVMALTGAGGGILAVPLLIFFLHLPVTEAAPIGLIAISAAASIGTLVNLKKGLVRYRAASLMAFAGVVFSPLGIMVANAINNHYLVVIFSIIVLHKCTILHIWGSVQLNMMNRLNSLQG